MNFETTITNVSQVTNLIKYKFVNFVHLYAFIERLATDQKVAGSTPARRSIDAIIFGGYKYYLLLHGVVAQLVEPHNGIVGGRGSNPLGSTRFYSLIVKDLLEIN